MTICIERGCNETLMHLTPRDLTAPQAVSEERLRACCLTTKI
jgi:hypothetical protein